MRRHEHNDEWHQLNRIVEQLERVNERLDCICEALQAPKAQSATLEITKEK